MLGAVQGPPRRSTRFRPRATLALLYFFGFFAVFVFLFAAPAMWRFRNADDTDPQAQEALERAVQESVQPRLWIALVLAAAATVIGGRTGVLPGSREKSPDSREKS